MNSEKLYKGQKVFLVTNKYSLTDSRIVVTVVKVVDWQNVHVRLYSAHEKDEVVKSVNATHLEELTKELCIEHFNLYRRRAIEFREMAVELGFKPKSGTSNKGSNEGGEATLQSE